VGKFNRVAPPTNTRDTLFLRTGSNGRARFRYVASQFGGVEVIKARALSDTSKWDTLSVVTRVPGLDSLGNSSYYVKVGAPQNHSGTNDPCRVDTPKSRHYSNHYGTARLRNAVQQVAVAYDSLHQGMKLRINDMSLIYGGLFDASENDSPPNNHPWSPPHSEHRIGINADIGYGGINSSGQCVSMIDTTDIQKMIYLKTEIPPLHHRPGGRVAPHFHMYVKKD
jgi:hypothetical protein